MNPAKPYPSQTELRALFRDIGDTVVWQITRNNRTRVGHEVRTRDKGSGYYVVAFFGQRYYVHRILWIMRNGEIPQDIGIDHIDGNVTNNLPSNLRLADNCENHWNMDSRANSSSGHQGVSWNNREGKWAVRIGFRNKRCFLGYFADLNEAATAAHEFRKNKHKEFYLNGQLSGGIVNTNNALNRQIGGEHYKSQAIQPIEFSMANDLDACAHTALKYVSRHQRKGGRADLEKAFHCVELRQALATERHRLDTWVVEIADYCRANGMLTEETDVLTKLCAWVESGSPLHLKQLKDSLLSLIDLRYGV